MIKQLNVPAFQENYIQAQCACCAYLYGCMQFLTVYGKLVKYFDVLVCITSCVVVVLYIGHS